MLMKDVTKTSLMEFIEGKSAKQKADVKAQIYKIIDAKINPIMDERFEFSALEKEASKFHDLLEEALGKMVLGEAWKYQQIRRDVDYHMLRIGTKIKEEYRNLFRDKLLQQRAYSFGIKEFDDAYAELEQEIKPLIKRIDDIKKLHSELEKVVKVASGGSRAYKDLVALGVDLSDYEVKRNLPALTTLSVDVCLINGKC